MVWRLRGVPRVLQSLGAAYLVGDMSLSFLARVSSLDIFPLTGEIMVFDFIIARIIKNYKPIIHCLDDINLKSLASENGKQPILP